MRGSSHGGAGAGPKPHPDAPALPASPPCPFCEGTGTELVSAFGSHASVSTYWCRSCRSPFELLKWRSEPGPGRGEGGDADAPEVG